MERKTQAILSFICRNLFLYVTILFYFMIFVVILLQTFYYENLPLYWFFIISFISGLYLGFLIAVYSVKYLNMPR